MQLKDWLEIKKQEMLTDMKKAVKYNNWMNATTLGFNSNILQAIQGLNTKFSRMIELNTKLREKQSSHLCKLAERFGIKTSSTFADALQEIKRVEIAKRPILGVDSWQLIRVMTPQQLKTYIALEV